MVLDLQWIPCHILFWIQADHFFDLPMTGWWQDDQYSRKLGYETGQSSQDEWLQQVCCERFWWCPCLDWWLRWSTWSSPWTSIGSQAPAFSLSRYCNHLSCCCNQRSSMELINWSSLFSASVSALVGSSLTTGADISSESNRVYGWLLSIPPVAPSNLSHQARHQGCRVAAEKRQSPSLGTYWPERRCVTI